MRKHSVHKRKLNIVTTLISQLVATACGIVIPRVMIGSFGSAAYGLTTSIAQFLSYISLLEGGIGRVARAELYAPLAQNNSYEISRVYHAIKHFFRIVGSVFLIYTFLLSFVYCDIAKTEGFLRAEVSLLIWIISLSTLAKYLGGLANLTLMNADQKQYIGNTIVMGSTILNALLVVVLARLGGSILTVKLGSSLAYIAQPLCYAFYVRRHYDLPPVGRDRSKLKQKWTGIGQHIAYFLHTNTDVVLLTLFADIRLVAVYSVYRLVISSIRKITSSFTGGMEAAFGELFARGDTDGLRDSFRKYSFTLSSVTIVLFGTTAALILPFVRLYTAGVTDTQYIQPAFAMVLLFAEALDGLVHPCASLPVAANQLKQTRWGSYGEALINIVLSLVLIRWNPLVGIAIGTLAATLFKSIYYMAYSARHILKIRVRSLIANLLYTCVMIGAAALAGMLLIRETMIPNFAVWCVWGVVVFAVVTAVTVLVSAWVYPAELKAFLGSFLRRGKKS